MKTKAFDDVTFHIRSCSRGSNERKKNPELQKKPRNKALKSNTRVVWQIHENEMRNKFLYLIEQANKS
jgi:hypothetical protein